MAALSQGTSHPESGPYTRSGGSRVASRHTRPPARRDSSSPTASVLLRRPLARASVEPISWSALPCWWSAERWLAHVVAVYRRGYLLTRPQLVAATGGGVSLRAVLAVATAHARAGDYRTGRCSRPLLGVTGGTTGITATTQLGQRTVTRARTWLRLVGLATEVAPGRHRTYLERMDSWRRGDTARGWCADYALHPSTTHPVDNPGRVVAGQTPHGTPPRSGISTTTPPVDLQLTTATQHGNGRAPRAATNKDPAKPRARRRAPDARGLLLATRWRAHPDAPAWARKNTATAWAGLLAAPARHGWTARDLNQLLDDHTATHGQLLSRPRRPIGYLSWLLHHTNLADRPCALDDARAADELAQATQRKTNQAAAAAQHSIDRQLAQADLGGAGHAAARAALAAAHERGQRR